jgi:thiol-disulfide isomerase/thioredoxin
MSSGRFHLNQCLSAWLLIVAVPVGYAAFASRAVAADVERNVLIEVYYRDSDYGAKEAIEAVEGCQSSRGGITLVLRDLDKDERNKTRLDAILQHFKVEPKNSPLIYGCNRIIHDWSPSNPLTAQLATMLQLEVFVRTGCAHCEAAEQWLPSLAKEYPALELVYRDIAVDPAEATRLSQLVRQHQTAAATVPVFHVCDSLLVGFQNATTTGERLRAILKRWTHEPTKADGGTSKAQPDDTSSSLWQSSRFFLASRLATDRLGLNALTLQLLALHQGNPSQSAAEILELPLPGDDLPGSSELPLPSLDSWSDEQNATSIETNDHIDLPLFGKLSASKLGMPIFTLAVGLVDGFNPCAMWVLLFLLSILVNLKSRARILAIAGTFVIVSGLAYFAFMAAWLNVFMLIGYLRPIQIGLAIMAIAIGAIHIKDFFSFKQGLSLSIPESSKPGIYARVRAIVTAEHLTGAVIGAITLAVLVNIVELLCTAGLPALYTNVLMQQGYSSGVRYAYLALYIVAYMVDDSIMVGIVTLTLSRKKMQETHGRWLKLVSGTAILLLGVVMLLKPEWLQ